MRSIGTRCFRCGRHLDASTATTRRGGPPHEGDVSICFYCAAPAIFTGRGVEIRRPTARELLEITNDPEIERVRRALFASKRRLN